MPPAAPPSAPPMAQNSSQAMQNLQGFTGAMQSPQAAMDAANKQYGVQQQQQQVSGLRQAIQNTTGVLNQVAPSIMGRTANSLVTAAQANRQIQNEEAPLNTQRNQENQDYTNANSNLQDDLTQASNLANANLNAQGQQESYLQGIYNDLYTQEQNAAQLAEQEREANLQASSASSGGSLSAAQQKADAQTAFNGDLVNAFANFGARPTRYTENTIIPTLAAAYPEIDAATIAKDVYAYRKAIGYG